MSLDLFTEKVKDIVTKDDNLNYKVKFIFEEGVVYVDGTVKPNIVSNEDNSADSSIKMSLENAHKFLDGNLNSTMAFMMGQIKVDGSLGVAMKIVKMIEG